MNGTSQPSGRPDLNLAAPPHAGVPIIERTTSDVTVWLPGDFGFTDPRITAVEAAAAAAAAALRLLADTDPAPLPTEIVEVWQPEWLIPCLNDPHAHHVRRVKPRHHQNAVLVTRVVLNKHPEANVIPFPTRTRLAPAPEPALAAA